MKGLEWLWREVEALLIVHQAHCSIVTIDEVREIFKQVEQELQGKMQKAIDGGYPAIIKIKEFLES